MKQILCSILLFLSAVGFAQNRYNAYVNYIDKYASLAVEQQNKHHIPASITLAQGLLESGAGLGELARKSNNHFGIKCANNWTGEKVYYDDDAKGECFRKYKDVKDSYEDHSLFLSTRSRYASLFKLEATDYKGWARGLKSAGYATDPNYANKLIQLIENYDLQQYDKGKKNKYTEGKIKEKESFGKKRGSNEMDEFPHDLYKNNGVKCVFSLPGDTYESIAAEYDLSEKKILTYNDLTESEKLQPGTVVYLQKKKNKSSKEFKTHIVQDGENMYRISQKYAIKLQKLYDMNRLPYTQGATVGLILKLR